MANSKLDRAFTPPARWRRRRPLPDLLAVPPAGVPADLTLLRPDVRAH